MKTIFFATVFLITLSCTAQSQFVVTQEGSDKILKGIFSQQHLSQDTAFKWYAQNQSGYTPPADVVTAFKSKASQVQVIAFGGTWCEDTKQIFPKFFSILNASAFPSDHLTLVGVDRNKKTIGHLAEALNVLNVPTFIILKEGREVGRVVEYGKTGQWEKELGEILKSVK
jgi:hypothetical protein